MRANIDDVFRAIKAKLSVNIDPVNLSLHGVAATSYFFALNLYLGSVVQMKGYGGTLHFLHQASSISSVKQQVCYFALLTALILDKCDF